MPESEFNEDHAMPDKPSSAVLVEQNNVLSTEDTLKTILRSQEELRNSFSALQQQILLKPSDNDEVVNDGANIVNKLEQIQEEILRQPAQLRGLKRQVNLVTAVVGQSRYKSLVERLLNFLDLVTKAQTELNNQIGDSGKVDFIAPLYTELLQILNLNDVNILEVNAGQEFDAKLHKCVFIQQVSDEDATNKIYQVVKPGYYYTGSDDGEKEILRHAEVVVTQFHQDVVNEEKSNEEEDLLPDPLNESAPQLDELENPDDSAPEQLEDKSIIESDKGE